MIIHAAIYRVALYGLIWWVLTGGHEGSWKIGIPSIVFAVFVSFRLLPPTGRGKSFTGLLGFLSFFILNSVRSGLQIAALALKPKLDMQPGILAFPLELRNKDAQVLLAGTLSLLPGTLSLGLRNNCLFLHVIDRRMPIEKEVRSAEHRVARIFGEDIA
ncbi:Na+/H+ antiporter subunit E [Oxalobacteraceae bacterium R-40]|uniref:Na+/H+ antiporter subunit E n=1 Tax=Keguizhuia sedimenti TaxID=3064264 RepID=A0ABU1BT85_9BURK|nr:Na+/H+ antiporter subunit E [Oxalobacteraceae bacterium R-40]